MSAIDTLLNRNSHARLVDPGPDAAELNTILQAACARQTMVACVLGALWWLLVIVGRLWVTCL